MAKCGGWLAGFRHKIKIFLQFAGSVITMNLKGVWVKGGKYFLIVTILLPASSFWRNGSRMFFSAYNWVFTKYTSALAMLNNGLFTIRHIYFSRSTEDLGAIQPK